MENSNEVCREMKKTILIKTFKKSEDKDKNIELQRHQPLFIGAIIEEMATFFIHSNKL